MSKQITKATVKKDGVTVEYAEALVIDGKGKLKTHTIDDPQAPHPDLLQSLKILLPHFVLIAEAPGFKLDAGYLKKRKILDEPEDADIFRFQVNGVSISGRDDSEGVQLIGRLVRKDNKVISMTLPLEFLAVDGGYAHKAQLTEDLQSYLDEVEQYLEGKKAQLALFDAADGR